MPAPDFLARTGASLCSSVHDAVHAAIEQLLERYARPGGSLLDVGCWDGGRTVRYRDAGRLTSLHGVEIVSAQAAAATARGIDVARCDLESPAFPWADGSLDVVVCNQVLEHLKNVFSVMDEIARVLAPGGVLVASVPNLGSLHSRIMLLLGMQPSMIRVFGPHVRSFTLGEFIAFLTAGRVFELVEVRGVGLYPLPARGLANLLGRIWPAASHTPVVVCRRTATAGYSWARSYGEMEHQTAMG